MRNNTGHDHLPGSGHFRFARAGGESGSPTARRRHGHHPMSHHEGFSRFGPGFGPGHGRRSRRGDVRAAVLILLEESPRNGYQLIQEIESRSSGAWRPSPGSIYPVLSQLEDEGLVVAAEQSSGRTFQLTDAGQREVEANRQRFGRPWETAAAAVSEPRFALMRSLKQVVIAVRLLRESGTDEQISSAADALTEARRKIYQILADGADD